MPFTRTEKLESLNAYQIAGLAMLVSTAAAVATLVVLRRTILKPAPAEETNSGQPGVGLGTMSGIPNHFSENLVVPGFTETGREIMQQDADHGRSPEGV